MFSQLFLYPHWLPPLLSLTLSVFLSQQLLFHNNTVLSEQLSEELPLWPVPGGRRRGGVGCGCPGSAAAPCARLFHSILLHSALVEQKGEAQAMLPAPAATLGFLPEKETPVDLVKFLRMRWLDR